MKKIIALTLALTMIATAAPLAFSSADEGDAVTKGTLLSDEQTADVKANNDKIAMDAGTLKGTNVKSDPGYFGDNPTSGGDDKRYSLFDDESGITDGTSTRFCFDPSDINEYSSIEWEIQDTDNPAVPAYLVMTTAHNAATNKRHITEFKFSGATADGEWVELAAAGALIEAINSHAYGIQLEDTTTAFTRYKLEAKCGRDDYGANAFQLSDLSVYAAEDEPDDPTPDAPSQKISDAELAEVLFGKTKISAKAGSTLDNDFWWDGEGKDGKADLVFDGNRNTTKIGGYTKGAKTVTITWETAEEVPSYLVLFTGHDSEYNASEHRNPMSFVLYGTTASGSKVVLVTAGDEMTNVNCYPTGWAIDTEEAITKYQLVIETSESAFQLEEIELYSDVTAKEPDGTGLAEGRYGIGAVTSGLNFNCGFLDGNMWFRSETGYMPIHFLSGGHTNTIEMLSNVRIFINGVEAPFNLDNWTGVQRNCGFAGSQDNAAGVWIAAFGAPIQKGGNEVVFLLGEKLYSAFTYDFGEATAVEVVSSDVSYFHNQNRLVATVTFAEAQGYAVGDEVIAYVHDEHDGGNNTNPRTFVVEAVDGNTVTFVSKDEFKVSANDHSILEFRGDGVLGNFAVIINKAPNTDEALGYLQVRPNATPGTFDVRILVEAYKDYLAKYGSAKIEATFTLANGDTVVKVSPEPLTEAWASIIADNKIVNASGDCGWLGLVVTEVPDDVVSVGAAITFYNEDGTVFMGLGSHTFTDADKVIGSGSKYDADKIGVYTDDSYTTLVTPDGESVDKMFDGTAYKMGGKDGPVYFATEEAVTITGLVFTCGNDSMYYGDRSFKDWHIFGKAENGDWVLVAWSDTPTTRGVSDFSNSIDVDIDDPSIADGNRDYYLVEGAGAYSQYKLEYTREGGYTQMAEITLYVK